MPSKSRYNQQVTPSLQVLPIASMNMTIADTAKYANVTHIWPSACEDLLWCLPPQGCVGIPVLNVHCSPICIGACIEIVLVPDQIA